MARRKAGKQPDFILKMKSRDKSVKDGTRIGAGWINSKGGIGIKLSLGVVIDHRDSEEYIITLWPDNAIAEALIDGLEEEREGDE